VGIVLLVFVDFTLLFLFSDSEISTSTSWSSDCQLLTCGDDKVIFKWGPDGENLGKVASLNVFATCVEWFPAFGKQVKCKCSN
jgi:hypothetical protein